MLIEASSSLVRGCVSTRCCVTMVAGNRCWVVYYGTPLYISRYLTEHEDTNVERVLGLGNHPHEAHLIQVMGFEHLPQPEQDNAVLHHLLSIPPTH